MIKFISVLSSYKFIVFFLFIAILNTDSFSQSSPQQYVVIYQADTVNRLQSNPPSYVPKKLKVYVKRNSHRIELLYNSLVNPLDSNKIIEIRNDQGIYITLIESDPFLNREIKNLYVFFSEKETCSPNKIQYYFVEKTTPVRLLKFKCSKIIYRDNNNFTREVIFTKQIRIPLLSHFESIPLSLGSPLQFVDEHDGWKVRYTATSLQEVALDESMFLIEPNSQIVPASKD